MNRKQFTELLMQSLEHEKGGVLVYETALECAINDDLREEWTKYLDETRNHVRVLTDVCAQLELDPDTPSPGRTIVQKVGGSLVAAMEEALNSGSRQAAQLVACECVVIAETKDHLDWHLLGKCAQAIGGRTGAELTRACEEVEDQEDEHLYHSTGWCRELWIESLGMKAILPPPEERSDAKTAMGAARAVQTSERSR